MQEPDARNRRILGLAALEVSGESGYRNLGVDSILQRAGLDHQAFYRCFDDPAACYAAGYVTAVDELTADLLEVAYREESWADRLRAGLESLGRFLEAEPFLARGIFLEFHAAGGGAAAKHDEVFERLSRAVDTARREIESRHSPPPIASTLILNMIEAAASRWLQIGGPEPFAKAVPDLLYVAVAFYFGREEAKRQVRRS
jgi:AcrR family transcriptional regulator